VRHGLYFFFRVYPAVSLAKWLSPVATEEAALHGVHTHHVSHRITIEIKLHRISNTIYICIGQFLVAPLYVHVSYAARVVQPTDGARGDVSPGSRFPLCCSANPVFANT